MNIRRLRALNPINPEYVMLVIMSDTHERHREVEVPAGDILIHAGDFSCMSRSLAAFKDFNRWLGELPHAVKVVIPGNNDYTLEDPTSRYLITNAELLINKGTDAFGLHIWGSPTTPLYGGAFGMSSEQDRVSLYSQVPPDTDILITHGPPFGILDWSEWDDQHQGCKALRDAVGRVGPRIHIFGHIHDCYGTAKAGGTLFVNAALLGPTGALERRPHVIKIPIAGAKR
jgi:Icc-related predicted phosphoesterase